MKENITDYQLENDIPTAMRDSIILYIYIYICYPNVGTGLGSVAQLDARSTGDQEGMSSRLWSGNILLLSLIMKSFLRSFSPLPLIKEGKLSVTCERISLITG